MLWKEEIVLPVFTQFGRGLLDFSIVQVYRKSAERYNAQLLTEGVARAPQSYLLRNFTGVGVVSPTALSYGA